MNRRQTLCAPTDCEPQPGLDDLERRAWTAIRTAVQMARRGYPSGLPAAFVLDERRGLMGVEPTDPAALLLWRPREGWTKGPGCPALVSDMLDLYLPLCRSVADKPLVVGHLGQSLDGFIATTAGDSCWVTGRENILHLHRMRALSDAVLVGAETVAADDPRLTTRLVPGDNPVRVVLDPRRRLPADRRVFRDGEAPTLLLCVTDRAEGEGERLGRAEVIGVPVDVGSGWLALGSLLAELHRRGLGSVFIEGGGVTVSAFLRAGLLDRLQVAVAPVIVGEGRRGVQLPPAGSMGACLRPRCRLFRMGPDVLFDCEPGREPDPGDGAPAPSVVRVG